MNPLSFDDPHARLVRRPWIRALWTTAVLALVFAAVSGALLALDAVQVRAGAPLESAPLARLQSQIAQTPNDEAAKQALRELDWQLRRRYFRHVQFQRRGILLLAAGLVAFVVASGLAIRLTYEIAPGSFAAVSREAFFRERRTRLWAVVSLALILFAALVLWPIALQERPAPSSAGGTTVAASTAPRPEGPQAEPDAAFWRRQWPAFRGPDGCGIVAFTNIPRLWDGVTGSNILWRSPALLPGNGSPVLWDERVYLTGATRENCGVFAYDLRTGALVWSNIWRAAGGADSELEVLEDTGYAASTPVTDGRRVWAMFANGELAGLTIAGTLEWKRNFGPLENIYGYAASLAYAAGRVILQLDQGSAAEDVLSRLYALDGRTGQTVWQTPRPVPNSWASPLCLPAESGGIIVAAANPWIMAYDAASGRELWRAGGLAGDVAPSPVACSGMVYAVNAHAALCAIRLGGRGDVTATHTAWKAEDNLPDICSPLCAGGLVFLLTTQGLLTCFDAARGEKMWEQDLGTIFKASPVMVDRLIYLIATDGVTLMIDPWNGYREAARAAIPDTVYATPAFADGRIVIRGEKHLWCIGAPR